MSESLSPDSLLEHFASIEDPRVNRTKRHPLPDILFIAICGAICGVDNWVELERFGNAKQKWFSTFLELPNGIPSHDTFGRVFSMLDPDAFRKCFIAWVESFSNVGNGDIVAIDGKSIRRSFDHATEQSAIHMVNAWCAEAGLSLGQLRTEAKSNEITAIPLLLELLNLDGCIVTIDAIGCQTAIAETIVKRGADYVLQVKGNQPKLLDELTEFFKLEPGHGLQRSADNYLKTTNGGHGRIEVRTFRHTTEYDWIRPYLPDFTGLNSIGMVESKRTLGDKTSMERRYFISSLAQDDVTNFARAARGHWAVENQLHWVLDVAFDEDNARMRVGNAAENMAIVRQIALNLLKQEATAKVGIKTKRKMCGWDHDYLLRVLKLKRDPN